MLDDLSPAPDVGGATNLVSRSSSIGGRDGARGLGRTAIPGPDLDGPSLDEDGLLRHGGRWVAITDAQLPVMRLLISRLGRLVRDSDLLAAYQEAGGLGDRESMRSLVHRVAMRVEQVGLELRAVRGRGVVLDIRALHPS